MRSTCLETLSTTLLDAFVCYLSIKFCPVACCGSRFNVVSGGFEMDDSFGGGFQLSLPSQHSLRVALVNVVISSLDECVGDHYFLVCIQGHENI